MRIFWQPAANQSTNYRRQHDAADHMPFVVALAAAFDRGAIKKEPGNRLVLATLPDGTISRPAVTLQQLTAVSFKVLILSLQFCRLTSLRLFVVGFHCVESSIAGRVTAGLSSAADLDAARQVCMQMLLNSMQLLAVCSEFSLC